MRGFLVKFTCKNDVNCIIFNSFKCQLQITAFATLTVASPDIGLLLRQQQQGLDGYEYQPQQHNHQLNNYLPLFQQQQGYEYQPQYNYQQSINNPSEFKKN